MITAYDDSTRAASFHLADEKQAACRNGSVGDARAAAARCSARESRDLPRFSGHLQDVQAGIGPIDHVDLTAIIDLDIVGLYGHLAAISATDLDALRFRLRGDRRDELRDLARVVRIANVDRAHAGIEVREKQDAAIVDRRVAREFRDIHFEQRERGMCAHVRRQHQPPDFRVEQVRGHRLRRSFEHFLRSTICTMPALLVP
jgi:hypothetical protein